MKWDGLWIGSRDDVYAPGDDTFLLARAVAEHVGPGTRFLEVGCGAGVASLVAARAGAHVVATDVNPAAVALTRHNARENGLDVEAVQADLLAGVQGAFDVVAFNPPYLPTAEDEHVEGNLDLAFDGGPDGDRVVLRFVAQLADRRDRPETVLVVHSDLSGPRPLVEAMEGLGYTADVGEAEKHFFETLTVRRFRHD